MKMNKLISGFVLCLLSFNANSAVLATWDINNVSGLGTFSCSTPCDIPPNLITFTTVSYDNNIGNPIPYVDLFVFEELIDTSSTGQVFTATSETAPNFDYFVSRMTNGIDEELSSIAWLGDARQNDGSFFNNYGGSGIAPLESVALNKLINNSSPDLFWRRDNQH